VHLSKVKHLLFDVRKKHLLQFSFLDYPSYQKLFSGDSIHLLALRFCSGLKLTPSSRKKTHARPSTMRRPGVLAGAATCAIFLCVAAARSRIQASLNSRQCKIACDPALRSHCEGAADLAW